MLTLIHAHNVTLSGSARPSPVSVNIVAIFYPFSLFCEMNISLLSLQTQPNTAPNLFQRGVEYGKYGEGAGDDVREPRRATRR